MLTEYDFTVNYLIIFNKYCTHHEKFKIFCIILQEVSKYEQILICRF